MAALTAPRSTTQYGLPPAVLPETFYLPVYASTTVYQGGMACVNSTGYVIVPPTSAGGTCVGRIEPGPGGQSVFTAVASGSVYVTVRQGCFLWDNSASNALALANFGQKAYAVDDHTMIDVTGKASLACAGLFVGLDSATSTLPMVMTVIGGFGAIT